jgi:hypothetical protein
MAACVRKQTMDTNASRSRFGSDQLVRGADGLRPAAAVMQWWSLLIYFVALIVKRYGFVVVVKTIIMNSSSNRNICCYCLACVTH